MRPSASRRLFTVQVVWSDADPDLLTISYDVHDLGNNERAALAVGQAKCFPGDPILTGEAQEVLATLMYLVGQQLTLF